MSDTPLRVGDLLYGFCGGHFGRDSYEDKRIEAIGSDWIVCRDEYGHVHTAEFHADRGWKVDDLAEFRQKPPDEW